MTTFFERFAECIMRDRVRFTLRSDNLIHTCDKRCVFVLLEYLVRTISSEQRTALKIILCHTKTSANPSLSLLFTLFSTSIFIDITRGTNSRESSKNVVRIQKPSRLRDDRYDVHVILSLERRAGRLG